MLERKTVHSETQPGGWRRMRGHLEHWNCSMQPSWTQSKVMPLFWMLCSKGIHSSCEIPKETLQNRYLSSQVEVWEPFLNLEQTIGFGMVGVASVLATTDAWRYGSGLCPGTEVWMVTQPVSGSSEDSWIHKSHFDQPWPGKNLESATEGRVAEAPKGEEASGDVHKALWTLQDFFNELGCFHCLKKCLTFYLHQHG